jgi:isoleucyl-tRNA synthetase
MYKPVDKFPDLRSIERRVLELWKETRAFERLREKNRGNARWSFLDGPITANNPMGVHHAWGRTLKDIYQRYHAMLGHDQRWQNGFDCQGLWVEVEVEKEKGFKSKQDIEAYGMDRFVEDCKARVRKYSAVQTEQSIRLGYWMDWGNDYFTMSDENNYTIWSFLKRCHDRGHVYFGADAMPWCPRCGVGLSQMELHEGYRWVEHTSVFLRFPIRGREREALLVWTTTPWTLTSNVGAAVHPDMDYLKVRAGDWTYVVGAANWEAERHIEIEEDAATGKKRRVVKLPSLPKILGRLGDVEVLDRVPGRDLVGIEYDGPFDDLPAQSDPGGYPYADAKLMDRCGVSCHRVVQWDLVTGTDGTGIVHIAPGCGAEDFVLGKEQGLVAISPLADDGRYFDRFGEFAGKYAHDVAPEILVSLKRKGVLVANEEYPHRYAHCWRCATPIVYRLVDEWFIDMSWRQEILGTVDQVRWIPEYGRQLEGDWLRNMGDWMISKKRYWGLALPIWRCDRHAASDPSQRCDWFTVIGGRDELEAAAIAGFDEFDGHSPHRPWIDGVKVRCGKCGGVASRVPEVGNPWLDAGIVPFSTMGFSSDRSHWEKWFPADLVLECFPGQFRNWFYSMLAMSAMMQEDRWADRQADGVSRVKAPFKTLVGHALVRDEEGREMHKSLGNAIAFETAADRIGAEAMRYIFATQNPVNNLNFPDIAEDRPKDKAHRDVEVMRELLTFWNCYLFYVTYAEVDGFHPDRHGTVGIAERAELDRWILSKFEKLVLVARDCYENFRVHLLMQRYEQFVNDLSTWYLRRSRRRFWKGENDADKLAAYGTLFEVLDGLCRVMAPILPFLTEEVYQNVVRQVKPDAPVSVHLLDFPASRPELADDALEARIDAVVKYVNLGLRLRNEAQLKVRQPLTTLHVKAETAAERAALEVPELRDQVLEELNVKALSLLDSADALVTTTVRADLKAIGKRYGKWSKEIQAHLAGVDCRAVRAAVAGGGTYRFAAADGTPIELAESEIEVMEKACANVATLREGGAFVALDTTVTPELRREGLARDFVRGVQDLRKEVIPLERVADRIRLRYRADGEVGQAIEEWRDYIMREVLATAMAADASLPPDARTVKVGKQSVAAVIEVTLRVI